LIARPSCKSFTPVGTWFVVSLVVTVAAGCGGSTIGTTAGGDAGTSGTKTCVALDDKLPAGAPNVPIKVGPAPAELLKEDLVVGTGAEVKPGATVSVDYIGATCTTGKIFDSSFDGGKPVTFSLTEVIKGWTEGIPGMKVGGQRLLGIPAAQAYGTRGSPPDIGPNEPLWFVVTVKSASA